MSRPIRARLRALAATLSPAALLGGPVFQLDTRVAGRRRGTYVARFVMAAGLCVLVGSVILGFLQGRTGSSVGQVQQLQRIAPTCAVALAWFLYVAMAVLSPLLTASAISDERRMRTISSLVTTPLSSAQIVLGKLASRSVQILILALMTVPLLLGVRVFGGLNAEFILATTCVSISTALLGASLGLFHSTTNQRTSSSAFLGIFSLALCQYAPLVVTIGVCLRMDINPPVAIMASSGGATQLLLSLDATGSSGPPLPPWLSLRGAWVFNTSYNTGLAIIVLVATIASLRRVLRREAAGVLPAPRKGRRTGRRSAGAGAADAAGAQVGSDDGAVSGATAALAAPPASPGREGRVRTVGDNPVAWRELAKVSFGSPLKFTIVILATIAIIAFIHIAGGSTSEGTHLAVVFLGLTVVLLHSAMVSASGITTEREARTWQVLLTTPLSPRRILWGKFIGALRAQWFLPAVVLAHLVLFSTLVPLLPLRNTEYRRLLSPTILLELPLIVLGPACFLTATGVLLSLVLRRTTLAIGLNVLLGIFMWLGIWLIGGLISAVFWFSDVQEVLRGPAHVAFAINPFMMTAVAMDAALFGMHRHELAILGSQVSPVGFQFIIFVVFAAYMAAAFGALRLAERLFPRYAHRWG